MREAECARSNLAEDLSRLRMELEKVISLSLFARPPVITKRAVDWLTGNVVILTVTSPHSMRHVHMCYWTVNM